MKSTIVKRSIVVAGHKTSVSLEDAFWLGLKEIADERQLKLSDLVGEIDAYRQDANLSSAIRLFVLGRYRDRLGFYREESSYHQDTPQEQLVGVRLTP
jgi:predicted DNA-binding ribbon-helix-helix protein